MVTPVSLSTKVSVSEEKTVPLLNVGVSFPAIIGLPIVERNASSRQGAKIRNYCKKTHKQNKMWYPADVNRLRDFYVWKFSLPEMTNALLL